MKAEGVVRRPRLTKKPSRKREGLLKLSHLLREVQVEPGKSEVICKFHNTSRA
jgi:hypothetical protein